MKFLITNKAKRLALYAGLFGCLFPLIATYLTASDVFQSTRLEALWAIQKSSALLWMINTFPLVLMLLAYRLGQQMDQLSAQKLQMDTVQSQLILQEQMASLGKMTAGIVHEIKNPLNFVSNFSEGSVEVVDELIEEMRKQRNRLIPDEYDYMMELIDDLRQNAFDIRNNSERVNRIVFTLLDHTRGSKANEKAVNINQLLEENVNLAFHSYRANYPSFNLSIEKNYAAQLPVLLLNAQSLGRVLLNLLNNACYALNQKQNTSPSPFVPTLSVETQCVGKQLRISIQDNGNGIPPNIQQQIFEPFFTTKPMGEGNTGLGLSISKDIIVKEYGGQLEMESEEGRFTKFTICIPFTKRKVGQKTGSTYLKSA
ncbi:MAG: ATP-binding protein [Bacteroidota bacterium]